MGWGGGLSKYSVYSWPSFVKVKARFGQVGDQVDQTEDQFGQGQGQELDNNRFFYIIQISPDDCTHNSH